MRYEPEQFICVRRGDEGRFAEIPEAVSNTLECGKVQCGDRVQQAALSGFHPPGNTSRERSFANGWRKVARALLHPRRAEGSSFW